jgi:hypothetical protein
MDPKLNGHYDIWCCLPVVATVRFKRRAGAVRRRRLLRPRKAPAGWAPGVMRALFRKRRAASPTRHVPRAPGRRLRSPRVHLLEREQVEYFVGMPSNRRLEKRAQRLAGSAPALVRQSGARPGLTTCANLR